MNKSAAQAAPTILVWIHKTICCQLIHEYQTRTPRMQAYYVVDYTCPVIALWFIGVQGCSN
jgi:hypothetical protein